MAEALDLDWLDDFRRAANGDPELRVVGEHFDATYSVDFGADRIAVRVHRGKVEEILRTPRFDVRAAFGLSAPVEVWQRFFRVDPPPLYHDVFAMIMRVPEFTLQGDGLVAMQNARALHRMMTVMRGVGAGHA